MVARPGDAAKLLELAHARRAVGILPGGQHGGGHQLVAHARHRGGSRLIAGAAQFGIGEDGGVPILVGLGEHFALMLLSLRLQIGRIVGHQHGADIDDLLHADGRIGAEFVERLVQFAFRGVVERQRFRDGVFVFDRRRRLGRLGFGDRLRRLVAGLCRFGRLCGGIGWFGIGLRRLRGLRLFADGFQKRRRIVNAGLLRLVGGEFVRRQNRGRRNRRALQRRRLRRSYGSGLGGSARKNRSGSRRDDGRCRGGLGDLGFVSHCQMSNWLGRVSFSACMRMTAAGSKRMSA